MKKNLFLMIIAFFVVGTSYAQMSFNGNTLKKSAFDLTEKNSQIVDDNNSSNAVFASDEETDVTKKRRRSKGRRRSGGSGDFSNVIKTNTINILYGVYGVQFERKIADNMSLSLSAGLFSYKIGSYGYNGYLFAPEFRYYFDEALEGLYFSTFINFCLFTESYTSINTVYNPNTLAFEDVIQDVKNSTSFYGLGLVGGRQWIWGGFSLDLYGGVQYLTTGTSLATGGLALGALPVLGVAIGYGF